MSTSIDSRQSLKRPCYEPPTASQEHPEKRLKLSMLSNKSFDLFKNLLGVLYFPTGDVTNLINSHVQFWASSELTHQYSEDGQGLDNPKLQALLDRLSVSIEENIAKATSLSPTSPYSFLQSLSPSHSRPCFKNRVLGETAFGNHDRTLFWRLSLLERERLAAAFLKYEIMCQVLRSRLQNLEQASHQCEEILKKAINRLHPWEIGIRQELVWCNVCPLCWLLAA